MARFEFRLPDIGEGVTEGEIVTWHVAEGDHVTEDQLMVEVMTDKATVTIGAPKSGRVAELSAPVGAVVSVGAVLVVLDSGNGSRATGGHPSKMPASAVGDLQESLPGASFFAQKRAASSLPPKTAPAAARSANQATGQAAARQTVVSTAYASHAAVGMGQQLVVASAPTTDQQVAPQPSPEPRPSKALATPAVRRRAREMDVDLRDVPGSGPDGRVTSEDLMAYVEQRRAPANGQSLPQAPIALPGRGLVPQAQEEQRIPFVGMRRKIAERMRTSKDTAAHFTFVEECDVTELMRMRGRLKEDAAREGVQLTYLPFVIKAVIAALKRHPLLNSRLDETSNEIVVPSACHIGVAAATNQGLLVPVVRDAAQYSLLGLAREVDRLGNAARTNQLSVQELSGSTFTVTSLGKQAGLFAVPIINPPNVGILGIHKVKERPVVKDGQIVIGHVMLLSLSMDHRIIDGHVGAAFAYEVIHFLEDPARLLLES